MAIRIIKPGMQTTVQDLGRWGYQGEGIPLAGAMDLYSLRLANLLCGNAPTEAVLEIAWHGFQCVTESPVLLACAGHGARLFINDTAFPYGRPIRVPAYSLLRFEASDTGVYSYLALAGGVDLERWKGSYSTYLPAGLGGWQGRSLRENDLLALGHRTTARGMALAKALDDGLPGMARSTTWGVDLRDSLPATRFRVMEGPELDWFTEAARQRFWTDNYRVSQRSNRMAMQLEGPSLPLVEPRELLSTAVCRGTVQVTHEGSPLVLMADAQTTGGYPRIAQVAAADADRFAQVRPGTRVAFEPISPEEAEAVYLARERDLSRIEQALAIRFDH